MKLKTNLLVWSGILMAALILIHRTRAETNIVMPDKSLIRNESLKRAAFHVLEAKCNVCHRKQNPFMIFKEKNMEKRAKKIYQNVFVERSMPKGNEIRLTEEEYATLEKWLFTQEIF